MKIKQIMEKIKKEYADVDYTDIVIVSRATANQTEVSYHTDKHTMLVADSLEYIPDDVADINYEILDTRIMNTDDLNHSVYANTGMTADADDLEIYLFVREI
jgi:hypothetical protein